jgi:methionyl-tRNA formyltransferase
MAETGWRIVVLTNIRGGLVYRLVDGVASSLGHKVVGVVTTPGRPGHRDPAYLEVVQAVKPGIDTIVTSHPNRIAEMIAPMRPDVLISGGFPWLLPPSVIAAPKVAAINMHPSLLPRWRGPNALSWVLRNGDPKNGFTVHYLDGAFDTGAILSQSSTPILDDDNVWELLERMSESMPAVLSEALIKLAAGDKGSPQDEAIATEAPHFEPGWRYIDWSQTARTIHNQVRSWTGLRGVAHGALGEIDGQAMVIKRTRLVDSVSGMAMAAPGTVLTRSEEQMTVQCGDGPLAIAEWEAEAE